MPGKKLSGKVRAVGLCKWYYQSSRPPVHVLFVGINPGVRSAKTGHHFAGYSNRFWKLLSDSRLAPVPIT